MINLLPEESQSQPRANFTLIRIGLLIISVIFVFSICCYLGYLVYQNSRAEIRLERINTELKSYSTSYREITNLETNLQRLRDNNNLKQKVSADYLAPLKVLNTLIETKPDMIWFEKIGFNGVNGSFAVTGGAINYKAFANFLGDLEQNKATFSQLKPEQATKGRDYIYFKISGILVKRGVTGVQTN
jgi:Tfp pilus assembly protein PilN